MGNNESAEYPANVAIEIGRVNSGCVYCLEDKTDEKCTATYDYGLPEDRVPTALLLNSNGAFDSFGTVAKYKFYTLQLKDKQHEYKYFDTSTFWESESARFTAYVNIIKHLYEICANIFDSNGKSKPLVVFTVSGTNLQTELEFMRSAARKAGIPEKKRIVLREIDAAAAYCTRQCLVVTRSADTKRLSQDTRFIVVNLGGYKTQYCTFEVKEKDCVKPLSDVESLQCGGETVTELFLETIESLVGKDRWKSFRKENFCSYVDIKLSFENCKRKFDSSTQGCVIEMPPAFMKMVDSETKQQSSNGICFAEDNKIIIEQETLKSVFDKSLQKIVNALKDTRSKTPDSYTDTDIILLVGGFAKSSYAREFISNEMKTNPVVLVPSPDLAVLKGAAMIKKPNRRSSHAYGFISANPNCQGQPQGENHSPEPMYKTIISQNEIVYTHQVFTTSIILSSNEIHDDIVLYQTDIKDEQYHIKDKEELCKKFKRVESVEVPVNGWSDTVNVELEVTVVENGLKFNLKCNDYKGDNSRFSYDTYGIL